MQAVFDIVDSKLVLVEVAPGLTVDDIRAKTEAEFSVSSNLSEIRYSGL